MAEIKLIVTLNTAQAKSSMGDLTKYITDVIQKLNKVTVSKDITEQIKAATDNFKAMSQAITAVTKAEKEKAAIEKTQSQTALNNAKAEATAKREATRETEAQTKALKEENRHIEKQQDLAIKAATADQKAALQNQENHRKLIETLDKEQDAWRKSQLAKEKEANRHQEANEKILTAQEKITASVHKSTTAWEKHSFTLGDAISRYAKFAVASALMYEPLRKIFDTLRGIDDVLVKTEDTVIALKRIAPEGIGTDAQIADDIYKLAQEYGQTFDNVQKITTNFARTGMSWVETLDATRAALLALNVAELDSTQASDGLIAVMSQFKIDAKDLTGVIDKMNKVADNFPVTTEKLLYALQRTGSAAVNANVSLEDTIGIITSLSEATGRSGQNLGTAVNALIQYSSKGSALEIFAKLNDETEKAVENFKSGAGSILDVWEEVSKVINNANERQTEILNGLSEMDEVKDLANDLHDELGDIFEQTAEVYGTANTFRKNYFISLLANIDTVRKASEVAHDAEGYSQKENAQYLETYTAKANELKSLWEDIANDAQGILGFKKGMADLGVSILTVIKNVGGLKTALVPVSTLMTAIFSKQITSKIVSFNLDLSNLGKTFKGLLHPIQAFTAAIDAKRAAMELDNSTTATAEELSAAHTAAMEAEATAAGVLNLAMLAVTAVIIGVTMAYSAHIQGLEDAAEAAQKTADKSAKLAEDLAELETKIDDGKTSTEELTNEFYKQLEAMGYTSDAIQQLIEDYDGLAGAIRVVKAEQAAQARRDAEAAYYAEVDAVRGKWDQAYGGIGWFSGTDSALSDFRGGRKLTGDVRNEVLGEYTRLTQAASGLFSGTGVRSFDNVDDEIAAVFEYKEALESLIEAYKALDDEEALQDPIYKAATDRYAKLMNEIDDLVEKYGVLEKSRREEAEILYKNFADEHGGYPKATNEIHKMAAAIRASEDYTDKQKDAMIAVMNAMYDVSDAAEEATEELSDLDKVKRKVTGTDLENATVDEILALYDEATAAGMDTAAFVALLAAKDQFNSAQLSVDDKVAKLNELRDAALEAGAATNAATGENNFENVAAYLDTLIAKVRSGSGTRSGGGGGKTQKTPQELAREAANAKITEADSAFALAQVDGTSVAGQVAALQAKATAQQQYVDLLKAQGASQEDVNKALTAYYQTQKQIADLEKSEADRKQKEYDETKKAVGAQFDKEINSLKIVYNLQEQMGAPVEIRQETLRAEVASIERQIDYFKQFPEEIDKVNQLETNRLTILKQIDQLGKDDIERKQKERIAAFDDEIDRIKTEATLRKYQGADEREQVRYLQAQQEQLHKKAEYYREIGKSQTEINKLSNEWFAIEEQINKVIEEQVKSVRELVEKDYDAYAKARMEILQTQLDSLTGAKEITNELLTLEEKRLAVQKAQKALLDAMEQKTVRVYNAETGRFEWTANAKAVSDARAGLVSAQQAYQGAKTDRRIRAAQARNTTVQRWLDEGKAAELAAFDRNAPGMYADSLRGTLGNAQTVVEGDVDNRQTYNYYIGAVNSNRSITPDTTVEEIMELMPLAGE